MVTTKQNEEPVSQDNAELVYWIKVASNPGSRRTEPDDRPWLHGVYVSSRFHEDRAAIIRAGHEWMEAFIPELNV